MGPSPQPWVGFDDDNLEALADLARAYKEAIKTVMGAIQGGGGANYRWRRASGHGNPNGSLSTKQEGARLRPFALPPKSMTKPGA